MTSLDTTRRALRLAVASRITPGAALSLVGPSGPVAHLAEGTLSYCTDAAAVDDHTIYDLASLTKVLVTTTLLVDLVLRQRVDLDQPVHDLLPIWRHGALSAVTPRHLLTHAAGLPAHLPLYQTCTGRDGYLAALNKLTPVAPIDTVSLYSDLGFIALGLLIERVTGHSLDDAYRRWVATMSSAPIALTFFPAVPVRPGSPRRSGTRGASDCWSVRSTTKTPSLWAARPGMPGCLERRTPSASSRRGGCVACSSLRSVGGGPSRVTCPAAPAHSAGTPCGPRHRAGRTSAPSRSDTPDSPAHRSGSTRSGRRVSSC